MQIAYLIPAHQDPLHLERLIRALDAPWARFFIHIDAKVALGPYHPITRHPKVVLLDEERVRAAWGSFGLVRATINLLKASWKTDDFTYYVLISGTDYPVQTNSAIYEFFQTNEGEFINAVAMPHAILDKRLNRLEAFCLDPAVLPSYVPDFAAAFVNRGSRLVYRRNYRHALRGMQPFAGSTWWALSRSAIAYVFDFFRDQRDIVKFFENSLLPDEMLFQTILANSRFRSRIRRNLTFSVWAAGGRHPAVIAESHLRALVERDFILDDLYGRGPCFFARKFSPANRHVLDLIDRARTASARFPKR